MYQSEKVPALLHTKNSNRRVNQRYIHLI
uniref:Uncharacterized protein n=1 Tax=Anguilla anguilla TaxID=7936 RepID=A0A0E9TKV8_ANGAN